MTSATEAAGASTFCEKQSRDLTLQQAGGSLQVCQCGNVAVLLNAVPEPTNLQPQDAFRSAGAALRAACCAAHCHALIWYVTSVHGTTAWQ